MAHNVTLDVTSIFKEHQVEDIKEQTLSLWLEKSQLHRQIWKISSSDKNPEKFQEKVGDEAQDAKITITPTEIRTFTVNIST